MRGSGTAVDTVPPLHTASLLVYERERHLAAVPTRRQAPVSAAATRRKGAIRQTDAQPSQKSRNGIQLKRQEAAGTAGTLDKCTGGVAVSGRVRFMLVRTLAWR